MKQRQQIEKIAKLISDKSDNPLEDAEEIYAALNKLTPVSEFASDVQKAYKEGYSEGFTQGETLWTSYFEQKTEEFDKLLRDYIELDYENRCLRTEAQTLRMQAIKEFAAKIKGKLHTFNDGGEAGAYIVESDIDELLKDFEPKERASAECIQKNFPLFP